ncbi:MAG: acetyl-CoA carboxylase biotin carboxylase subunit [Ardenticatenaceae bacterium]|nr:acetyl-CoA carboxylase biotin carboxylase subunit [Ardenticatenaceae bacterium]MCB9445567.1 acetyl-CoA carboxylase biotin carboxylase subunit [Ardenticatenaceae bacterium]
MFKKILVANRGEIARRILLACRELGVRAIAIYSEADKDAPWVRLADESYPLPGVTAVDTYLNQATIFQIARTCGAEAIHPGYGFLSENASFAQACADNGLVFVGPGPEAMRLMGSKAAARQLAQSAGVPVASGLDGAGKTDAELAAAAAEIGYPVLIKASAGGGGKGMRVVRSANEMEGALQAARREARSAFGDEHVILEKYFTEIHHVEIQILADQHGNVLHLFERECSVQRRHQKIIEESPAPVIQDDELRQRMAEAAVSLAQAANYVNAGTVEFIVDQSGGFYFLEMNTRLQVEHPITELVTGLDLATWQIRIANNEKLPYTQDALLQRGHAIECRIYAEDPANQFLPSIGQISYYQPPFGPSVRVDDGIESGSQVTPYYDPMLAKVITWGITRQEAVARMVRALRDTIVLGVTTNIPYLLAILQEADFLDGRTSTNYLAEHFAGWQPQVNMSESDWLALAALEALQNGRRQSRVGDGGTAVAQPDPWNQSVSWRNVQTK